MNDDPTTAQPARTLDAVFCAEHGVHDGQDCPVCAEREALQRQIANLLTVVERQQQIFGKVHEALVAQSTINGLLDRRLGDAEQLIHMLYAHVQPRAELLP